MKKYFIIDLLDMIGSECEVYGWVNAVREHGAVTFIDIRDSTGIIQAVFSDHALEVKREDTVRIKGHVKNRPEKLQNLKIPTGRIEVEVQDLKIITKALELPIPIDTPGYEIDEEIRVKYRYLDLRRKRMSDNIKLRSRVVSFIRNFLLSRKFHEIETPILTKTTPEGARDFLVPSRLKKGKFYALPQSPQQYKQLLMVAGFERYFQIARCFRDEDPRKDRAYGEFTQLDMEMSFVDQEDILEMTEELISSLIRETFPHKRITKSPWPRIPHEEAMKKYKTDKPDLRKNKADPDELAFAWTLEFPLFNKQSDEDFFHGSGSSRLAPSHHMFTSPHPDDISLLDSDPLKVRGLQHDLILNGFEVGGGSIRIHDSQIQNKIFELIGFSGEQKQQFSHMLQAFSFGVPPHGGIAPGIDRLLMAILGEPNLREVIAFPALSSGQTSVMDAPSNASGEQLQELGIAVKK